MDDASVSHCHAAGTMLAPSTLMHGMPSSTPPDAVPLLSHPATHIYHDGSPSYANPFMTGQGNHINWYSQRRSSMTGEEDPRLSHHQWRPGIGGTQFPPAQPYASTSYIPPPSSSEPFANSDPSSHLPSATTAQGTLTNAPHQSAVRQLPEDALSSWKGETKQELLETLLETIGSCDEDCVAQVIQVVRTSATPEEAVSGIYRVLGMPGR